MKRTSPPRPIWMIPALVGVLSVGCSGTVKTHPEIDVRIEKMKHYLAETEGTARSSPGDSRSSETLRRERTK